MANKYLKMKNLFTIILVLLFPVSAMAEETLWAYVDSRRSAKVYRQILPQLHEQARLHLHTLLQQKPAVLNQQQIRQALKNWEQSYCQITRSSSASEKRLRLLFFPKHLETTPGFKGWRKSPLLVGGGGSSIWQMEYDFTEQKFISLYFHGSN